jgi:serine/threonine protein kinase
MNLKIIDFGLCNHTKDGTTLFTGCGSPNYAAPELLMGCGYDGTEVDVWSSGVVLYAMATGKLPFDDEFENTNALFTKIRQGKFYMPVELSTELKDLINNLLQPLPMKRYGLEDIWKHPWVTGP